ncbi:MAG: LysM peptidoglycan-binding domain-containing protein [Gammaproteobacteria bacterium]|nr:LysM peptidoglycan-binding domain-containing protein [Gammaproteobacteria bacterium]MCW8987176.1 LysM peptidoglycan-binding domain-containing protein [Gammaproteobacteria bacterium]MCW9031334.1 LysM peptidoglycan-binding domain-containing protein [Gammaproteobacteria bacterium]
MLIKTFLNNTINKSQKVHARFFLVAISMTLLSGCVLQPVTDDSNSAAQTESEIIATEISADGINEKETSSVQAEVDTWQRIRNGFDLPDVKHKRIEQELNWFKRHPEYIKRVVERARPYLHYIIETVEEAGIPSDLALLPIVESAFQPFAYSHGRAAGIWQFIPETGKRYGLKQNWWYDGRRDVYASTKAAVQLLKNLNRNFNGNWMHALAAYNTGGVRVKRAIRHNERNGKPTDFFSLDLPKETRAYVPKLLALRDIIEFPEKYDIELEQIPNQPYFEEIKLDSQIDIALAAELADLPLDELYHLNSGYNRWATSPNGPFNLLLPVTHAEAFKTRLEELPANKRINWVRHQIREGETLSTIAQKYHTSISTIKRVNRLHSKMIRTGRSLTIPVASRSLREYRLSVNQRKTKLQNIPREGRKISHVVQQGDTFWDLARYHRVGVRQLAQWNSMAPRDRLQAGQQLIIWSRRGSSVSSAVDIENLSAPPRRNITKRIGYRVRNGDSLARISSKFKVSIEQLKRWNKNVSSEKYLQPGQWLTLIVDVARQSGNS